jgi:CheY-like chemotaxis protein
LTSKDYELIFVEKGKQILDLAMKKDIDLLILDVELPDMNGLEVLGNIRKLTKDMQSIVQLRELPVIMVTAYPREEIRKEAERLGVVSFLGKPVKGKELRKIVEDVLEGRYQELGRKKLILCVDSEPRVQRFYEGTLSSRDWDVITASNGIEALEAVEFKNPHLIITELNLPQMDGVEFLQTLKESNQDVPVIVISSVSEKEGQEKIQGLGVKKYLTKPFQLDELRKSVRDILRKPEEATA